MDVKTKMCNLMCCFVL